MGFLKEKIAGMRLRLQYARYGIFYFRSSTAKIPERLFLGRSWRLLRWMNKDQDFFRYEFNEICIHDCYKIKAIRKHAATVNRIVDIGANQGLFTLAARRFFPGAQIHCYEPNGNIMPQLTYNGAALNARVYQEAVTRTDCRVMLNFGETDLHSVTAQDVNGEIAGTALRHVIERTGGEIDLLKLDCEGAEWDLLDDPDSWKKIRSVTMEYHLWARPGSTSGQLIDRLEQMGFKILSHDPLDSRFGLLTAIRN